MATSRPRLKPPSRSRVELMRMKRHPSIRLIGLLAATMLVTVGCGSRTSSPSRVGKVRSCAAKLAAAGARGEFAFIKNGGVVVVDLPSCRTRVLVARSTAQPPVRFSADGRYVAFGDGAVIPSGIRGQIAHPLGRAASWSWSARGASLAGITASGAVKLWSPGERPRSLFPSGWDKRAPQGNQLTFSPSGQVLAVTRTTGPPEARGLWLVNLRTLAAKLLYRLPAGGQLTLAGFTPDGRYLLFWPDLTGSASIAADGLPLVAEAVDGGRPRILVRAMLPYSDFISPCTSQLVAAIGFGRETNSGKSLAVLSPPAYRATALPLSTEKSWVSPSCADDGWITAAAGASSQDASFGLQHRSIWLIPARDQKAVRVTQPGPSRVSDELPRISSDGRWILFIRARSDNNGDQQGELELASLNTHRGRPPLVAIAALGSSGFGYYDHYDWAALTAWHQQ